MKIIEFLDEKISQQEELAAKAEETIRTAEFGECAPPQLVERLKEAGFAFPTEKDEKEARSQRRAAEDLLKVLFDLREKCQEVKFTTASNEESYECKVFV